MQHWGSGVRIAAAKIATRPPANAPELTSQDSHEWRIERSRAAALRTEDIRSMGELSLPAGVPRFLLGIPGLGLLLSCLHPFAVFLDRTEAFFRRFYGLQV